MATVKRKVQDEDVISHYGSMSGETFASRRSRRDCSMRVNSIDLLAKNLREYHANPENGDILDEIRKGSGLAGDPSMGRFNKSFHHFRILVIMMGGCSVGIMLLLRYSITISILRMVNQTHLYLEEHPNKTVDDFLEEGFSLGGEFNWNNEIVAIILSWYMFSYTLPQMPAARLSAKIGLRYSVPLSLAICAISLLLTPWAAYLGWEYVVFLRLINGVGASAIMPMLLNLLEIWMRYDEISFGLSIAQTLNASFVTLTPLISGYLTEIHWSYAFYWPGAMGLVFCLFWIVLVSDSPDASKFVSAQELMYIHDVKVKDPSNQDPSSAKPNQEDKAAPASAENSKEQAVSCCEDEQVYRADSWVQIFRVPSFYAYMLMWCFYCSSYSGFTFVLPTYMRQFLKIHVAQNGFYCFVIQAGSILSVLWPHPTLRLLQRLGLSITKSRIVAHAICCSMVAATWIYVGAFHNTQLLMLFLNRCFHNGNDIIVTGSLMSNYARAGLSSTAFSLVNTIGNLSIVGASTLIGYILDYTGQSREGWRLIYACLGVSQLLMFMVFALFVDSDPIKFSKKPAAISPAIRDLELNKATDGGEEHKSKGKGQLNNFDRMKQVAASDDEKANRNKS